VQSLNAWEKIDDKNLEMLKEQKAFEDETAEKLTPLYSSVKNPFVRLFIHRIILDTKKHSDTYQTLIDLNKRVVIGETDRKTMTEELTTHITEENRMLKQAEKISRTIEDKNFKQILEQIVEDERQHHKILQQLFEILKKEGEDWNRYLYDMFTGAGIP
jgi:ribonucleotide reductase beta subunit family protein with ferritin-like domain